MTGDVTVPGIQLGLRSIYIAEQQDLLRTSSARLRSRCSWSCHDGTRGPATIPSLVPIVTVTL